MFGIAATALTPILLFFTPAATWALARVARPVVEGGRLVREGAFAWAFHGGRFTAPGEPLAFETLRLSVTPWSAEPLSIQVTPDSAWDREPIQHLLSTVVLPPWVRLRELRVTSGDKPLTVWIGGLTVMAHGALLARHIRPDHPLGGLQFSASLTNVTARTGRQNLLIQIPTLSAAVDGGRFQLAIPGAVAGWMGGILFLSRLEATGPMTKNVPGLSNGMLILERLSLGRVDLSIAPHQVSIDALPLSPVQIQAGSLDSFSLRILGHRGETLVSFPAGHVHLGSFEVNDRGGVGMGWLDGAARLDGGPTAKIRWARNPGGGDLTLVLDPFPFVRLEPLASLLAGWHDIQGRCLGLEVTCRLDPNTLSGRGRFHWQGFSLVDRAGEPMTIFRTRNIAGQGAQPLVVHAENKGGAVDPFTALKILGPELLQSMRKF